MKSLVKRLVNGTAQGKSPHEISACLHEFSKNINADEFYKEQPAKLDPIFKDIWTSLLQCSVNSSGQVRVATYTATSIFLTKLMPFFPRQMRTTFSEVATHFSCQSVDQYAHQASLLLVASFAFISHFVSPIHINDFLSGTPIFHHFIGPEVLNSDHLSNIISNLDENISEDWFKNLLLALMCTVKNRTNQISNRLVIKAISTLIKKNPKTLIPGILISKNEVNVDNDWSTDQLSVIAFICTSIPYDLDTLDLSGSAIAAFETLRNYKTSPITDIDNSLIVLSLRSKSFKVVVTAENDSGTSFLISLEGYEGKSFVFDDEKSFQRSSFYSLPLPPAFLIPKDEDPPTIVVAKLKTMGLMISDSNKIQDVEREIDLLEQYCYLMNSSEFSLDLSSIQYNELTSGCLQCLSLCVNTLIMNAKTHKLSRLLRSVLFQRPKSWFHAFDILRVIKNLKPELIPAVFGTSGFQKVIKLVIEFCLNKNEDLSRSSFETIKNLTTDDTFKEVTQFIAKNIDFFDSYNVQKNLLILAILISNHYNVDRSHLDWVFIAIFETLNFYMYDIDTMSSVFRYFSFFHFDYFFSSNYNNNEQIMSNFNLLFQIAHAIFESTIQIWMKNETYPPKDDEIRNKYFEIVRIYLSTKKVEIISEDSFNYRKNFVHIFYVTIFLLSIPPITFQSAKTKHFLTYSFRLFPLECSRFLVQRINSFNDQEKVEIMRFCVPYLESIPDINIHGIWCQIVVEYISYFQNNLASSLSMNSTLSSSSSTLSYSGTAVKEFNKEIVKILFKEAVFFINNYVNIDNKRKNATNELNGTDNERNDKDDQNTTLEDGSFVSYYYSNKMSVYCITALVTFLSKQNYKPEKIESFILDNQPQNKQLQFLQMIQDFPEFKTKYSDLIVKLSRKFFIPVTITQTLASFGLLIDSQKEELINKILSEKINFSLPKDIVTYATSVLTGWKLILFKHNANITTSSTTFAITDLGVTNGNESEDIEKIEPRAYNALCKQKYSGGLQEKLQLCADTDSLTGVETALNLIAVNNTQIDFSSISFSDKTLPAVVSFLNNKKWLNLKYLDQSNNKNRKDNEDQNINNNENDNETNKENENQRKDESVNENKRFPENSMKKFMHKIETEIPLIKYYFDPELPFEYPEQLLQRQQKRRLSQPPLLTRRNSVISQSSSTAVSATKSSSSQLLSHSLSNPPFGATNKQRQSMNENGEKSVQITTNNECESAEEIFDEGIIIKKFSKEMIYYFCTFSQIFGIAINGMNDIILDNLMMSKSLSRIKALLTLISVTISLNSKNQNFNPKNNINQDFIDRIYLCLKSKESEIIPQKELLTLSLSIQEYTKNYNSNMNLKINKIIKDSNDSNRKENDNNVNDNGNNKDNDVQGLDLLSKHMEFIKIHCGLFVLQECSLLYKDSDFKFSEEINELFKQGHPSFILQGLRVLQRFASLPPKSASMVNSSTSTLMSVSSIFKAYIDKYIYKFRQFSLIFPIASETSLLYQNIFKNTEVFTDEILSKIIESYFLIGNIDDDSDDSDDDSDDENNGNSNNYRLAKTMSIVRTTSLMYNRSKGILGKMSKAQFVVFGQLMPTVIKAYSKNNVDPVSLKNKKKMRIIDEFIKKINKYSKMMVDEPSSFEIFHLFTKIVEESLSDIANVDERQNVAYQHLLYINESYKNFDSYYINDFLKDCVKIMSNYLSLKDMLNTLITMFMPSIGRFFPSFIELSKIIIKVRSFGSENDVKAIREFVEIAKKALNDNQKRAFDIVMEEKFKDGKMDFGTSLMNEEVLRLVEGAVSPPSQSKKK